MNYPAGVAASSRRRPPSSSGATLAELVIVLGLAGVMAAVSLPLVAAPIDGARARDAASFVSGVFRHARQLAALRGETVAVVFDQTGTRWSFRLCADGNGNGVRRTDLDRGVDPCVEGPYALAAMFPGADVAVDATVPSPDGGAMHGGAVQFGTSGVASFTPAGTASSGSVYVRSQGGRQYAVRVAGATGRTRVLYFEPGTRRWSEE